MTKLEIYLNDIAEKFKSNYNAEVIIKTFKKHTTFKVIGNELGVIVLKTEDTENKEYFVKEVINNSYYSVVSILDGKLTLYMKFLNTLFYEEEPPYLEEEVTRKSYKYNPNYGDNRICECGHSYDRHFDSYEDMEPVGCKYCICNEFKEKK